MMYCIQIHQFTIHTVFNTLPLKMNGIFTNPNYTQYSAGSYFTFETDPNLITYYDCGPRTNNIAFHFAVELMHCPFIYSRRLFTVTLVCYVLLKLGFVLRHVLMNKLSARTILYELVCSMNLKPQFGQYARPALYQLDQYAARPWYGMFWPGVNLYEDGGTSFISAARFLSPPHSYNHEYAQYSVAQNVMAKRYTEGKITSINQH